MPKKQIVTVGSAAPNPNLSAAVRFGNLVFVLSLVGILIAVGLCSRDARASYLQAPHIG